MPSILAFFNDNKRAYNCLREVKKLTPKESNSYTIAQYEYTKEKKQISKDKIKTATKIGTFLGILTGFIVAISSHNHIFSHISHFVAFIIIVLISAGSGGIIGLLMESSIKEKNKVNYHEERGELILIIENPGNKKEEIIETIKKYNPHKLTIY
ncbi:hypothetical protein [Tepidibacter formicigenes]|jgi:hypothetical protein|uniref:Uncharacterized protein n=1 Tax=Tepidibacter formicigenes DSM 15518 TaxID=1123349 RepID=A0A1M6T3P1_9FIRM|nr:hypothetical protein [Tepidibacter formicigenes]SHK51509.1 hypothetical protein SAMN02744037_02500 [Tepidibacter formicigenes DSM 15518]